MNGILFKLSHFRQFQWSVKNRCEDNSELPQSRNTIFSRYQKKDRRGTNNDKTNAIYETADAQTKKKCNRGITLERLVEKKFEELEQVLLARNIPRNSVAAPNDKHMLSPHRGSLSHCGHITVKHIQSQTRKQQIGRRWGTTRDIDSQAPTV